MLQSHTTKPKTLETLIGILNREHQNPDRPISDWTISEIQNRATELFFIEDRLDLNRSVRTHEFSVSVYTDFTEDEVKYRGHASCIVGISDHPEEIEKKIEYALFSASFVKNKWYDLPVNHAVNHGETAVEMTRFENIADLETRFEEVHNIIYADYGFASKVNSCEIFAIEGTRRVITSKGTDVRYPYSEFTFEVVTDCNAGDEPVEIFNGYYLTHIDSEQIREIIKKQLLETEGRSKATRNRKLENQRVILSGDAVEDFLSFYIS